jgi:hypothetical protein
VSMIRQDRSTSMNECLDNRSFHSASWLKTPGEAIVVDSFDTEQGIVDGRLHSHVFSTPIRIP